MYIREWRQDNEARNTVCLDEKKYSVEEVTHLKLAISSNREFKVRFAALQSVNKDSNWNGALTVSETELKIQILRAKETDT